MKTYTKSCIDQLQEHQGKIGWWLEGGAITLESVTSTLSKLEFEIFNELNLSILTGQYVSDLNGTKEDLKEILRQITRAIPEEVLDTDPNSGEDSMRLSEAITNACKYGFKIPLETAIGLYLELILIVEKKLTFSNDPYFYYKSIELNRIIEEGECDKDSLINLKVFSANISIAKCDHFLSIDGEQFKKLKTHISFLEKNKDYGNNVTLILDKAKFLVAKLLTAHKYHLESDKLLLISRGEQMDYNEIYSDIVFYRSLIDDTLIGYELDESWKGKLEKCFNELCLKNPADMTFYEIHKLIKYHKDVSDQTISDRLSFLEKLRVEVQMRYNRLTSDSNPYDRYAYSINLNYIINNEISLACLDSTNQLNDKVEELYNTAVQIQRNTRVKNFFPQVKYVEHLLSRLNWYEKNKKVLENLRECVLLIDKCKQTRTLYSDNVKWTKDHYYLVYQLPLEESVLESSGNKIFSFSSFSIPLNKTKLQHEFSQYSNEVANMEGSIKVLANIEERMGTLEDLEQKVKSQETRTVELIGIFTAIVSFVAASVTGFNKIETGYGAAIFMLAIGTSFAFFVFLLLIALRELKKRKDYIVFGVILGIVLLIAWLWVIMF